MNDSLEVYSLISKQDQCIDLLCEGYVKLAMHYQAAEQRAMKLQAKLDQIMAIPELDYRKYRMGDDRIMWDHGYNRALYEMREIVEVSDEGKEKTQKDCS